MNVQFLKKNPILKKVIYKAGRLRARRVIDKIEKYLQPNEKIIDVGSGTCNICEILHHKQYDVTPLDVKDISFVNNIKPVVYDGTTIPYQDQEFDLAMLILVLHHTPYPHKIIQEVKRVAKRVLIIEEIYYNSFQKHFTFFFDSVENLEFFDHPHTNKSDKEWQEVFVQENLDLLDLKYHRGSVNPLLQQVLYYLENRS